MGVNRPKKADEYIYTGSLPKEDLRFCLTLNIFNKKARIKKIWSDENNSIHILAWGDLCPIMVEELNLKILSDKEEPKP